MKFNCDRCKTRYSISDDRVRGKVLKIRCKNCSAVITVREGVVVATPVVPEPPAPAPAPRTQEVSVATPPPLPAVVEWFMSIGGDQAGPFDLDAARRWVAGQPASAELHCWSEGFDDWLPVEKVSHFRALRAQNGAAGAVSDPYEKTPAPLFAETMKQMTAEAPTLLEDENPFSAAYERKKRETATGSASSPSMPPPIGEERPVISGLTMADAPRPEVLRPAPRRSPLLIPLIAATAVLLIVLAVLLYLALTGSDESSSEQVTRGGSASAAIARGVDDREPAAAKTAPDAAVETATRTAAARPETGDGPGDVDGGGYTAPPGEVDLSGAGSDQPVKQGTLEPGDIAEVYRRQQSSVNRCYANAIKRDPLLEVPKTQVTLEVAGSGRVTRVSIPSLAGKPLGSCLVASITRWTFPKSTEGFAGRFPIVFRSR